MSPAPLEVAEVVQRDYLRLGHQGREAAAVAGAQLTPVSARVRPVHDARLHVDSVRGRVPVVPEPTPGPSSPALYSGTDVTSPPG